MEIKKLFEISSKLTRRTNLIVTAGCYVQWTNKCSINLHSCVCSDAKIINIELKNIAVSVYFYENFLIKITYSRELILEITTHNATETKLS